MRARRSQYSEADSLDLEPLDEETGTRLDEGQIGQRFEERNSIAVGAYAGFITSFVFAVFGLLGTLWMTPYKDTLIVCGSSALTGALLYLVVRNGIAEGVVRPRSPFRQFVTNSAYLLSNVFVFGGLIIFVGFLISHLDASNIELLGSKCCRLGSLR